MLPVRGPLLFSVPGVSGVSIPALTVGSSITFYWSRPLFVTALMLLAKSASPEDMAALQLEILDETQQEIIFDGKGGHTTSALGLCGTTTIAPLFSELVSVKRFVLQRPVAAGDNWIIRLTNTHATHAIVPELTFSFDEGDIP